MVKALSNTIKYKVEKSIMVTYSLHNLSNDSSKLHLLHTVGFRMVKEEFSYKVFKHNEKVSFNCKRFFWFHQHQNKTLNMQYNYKLEIREDYDY